MSPECQAESKEVPAGLVGLYTQWALSQTSQGDKVRSVRDRSKCLPASHRITWIGLGVAFKDHQVQPPAVGKDTFHWTTLLNNVVILCHQQELGGTITFRGGSKQHRKRSRKSELCRLNYLIVIPLRKRIWKVGGWFIHHSLMAQQPHKGSWLAFIYMKRRH